MENDVRIEVSEAFRFAQTNCDFEMTFHRNVDVQKVMEAMVAALPDGDYYHDYKALWVQDLGDGCAENTIKVEGSTLDCMAFEDYIPAMCKAAASICETDFEIHASYDDLCCCYINEFEASFIAGTLTVKRTFTDDECGYFCPDCGCAVAALGEVIDNPNELECEDCEGTFKLSDLICKPSTVTIETFDYNEIKQ